MNERKIIMNAVELIAGIAAANADELDKSGRHGSASMERKTAAELREVLAAIRENRLIIARAISD